MDKMTKEQRHRCMAAIRSRNTKPEMLVRRYLFSRGFRYRLCNPRLPGHPDLVLRKYRTAIFVNGCFWHGHEGCPAFRLPKTNIDFWRAKIERNKRRDKEELQQLAHMGWHCVTVWECQLVKARREETLASLEQTLVHIFLQDHSPATYEASREELPMAAEPESPYAKEEPTPSQE
ncbi:MAG: very short patch repair endonuclease [Prevotellaceae bacterium]|nr:very short patch repair endonuclease [Prevotellaceae bacterium]